MPELETFIFFATLASLLVLAGLVAAKDWRNPIPRSFILFDLSIFFYTLCAFISQGSANLDTAVFWTRSAVLFAQFIPMLFFLFTEAFTGQKLKNKWVRLGILIAPWLMLPFTYIPEANIGSLIRSPVGNTIEKSGPMQLVLLVYLLVGFATSFRMLSVYAKRSSRLVQLQVKLMIYGIGTSVTLNVITQIILPKLGINRWGELIGNPSLILIAASVAYAILRQKLFDIKFVAIRSLAFVLTLIAATSIYAAVLFGSSSIFFPEIHLTLLEEVYFVAAAVILTLTLRNLFGLVEKLTDKVFFHNRYDAQFILNKVGKVLSSEIEMDNLTKNTVALINKYIHSTKSRIIVLEKGEGLYASDDTSGDKLEELVHHLNFLGNELLVAEELTNDDRNNLMKKVAASVFVPLRTRDEKIGYLLLSEKSSGSVYDPSDTKVIEIIADQLAVAIQNSRSYSQIERFNRTLQAKITQATKDLTQANARLTQMDTVKDDFISMASHQLGTPLAVIDGYLSMSTKAFYGPLSPKLQHALDSALDRAQVMKGLVNDLLNVSRMQAGKFSLQKESVNLNSMVASEVQASTGRAKEQKVSLVFTPSKNPIPAMTLDDQKTRQAVMNLIDNAIHYAPNGKVEVKLELVDDSAVFQVIDNGIGVPDSQKKKLFTKFFRADNAKEERPDGTGIGLYLVKRVVEDQGGKIIFKSQQGHGSTFGFSLPIDHKMPATK